MSVYVDCWHFAASTLRDGSPLPKAGVRLPKIHDPKPCERGYHGSVRAIDALEYAPGPYVARVRLTGVVVSHGKPVDKYVAERRRGLTDYVDTTNVLCAFARRCALDVASLWDMPTVVRRYLETGDESIRDAAWAAAGDATWAAAGDAAGDAARAAQNDRLTKMLTEVTS